MAIRVLHVVTSMDAGGIETMLMNLYRKIDRNKIQFDFLVHRDYESFYEPEIVELGGRVHRVRPIRLHSLVSYCLELNSFFKNHSEYRIVHSHISTMSYLVLKIAKHQGVEERYAHSHEHHETLRDHKLLRRPAIVFSKAFINNHVTHRFACSIDAGRWLFGHRTDIKVISNAIDAERYVVSNADSGVRESKLDLRGAFVVGHIGNFSKAKNYPFILEVFDELLKRNKNSMLVLVGKNESNPEVEERIRELGLQDNIILTGVRSDIPDLLAAMDAFLFPSLYEGLGMVLIEAQASGLKCLVSNSVPKEVKITDNVEFMPLEQPATVWAEKLLQYASGYERKNTYKQIVEAGYDIKNNVRWLEDFYLQAAEKEKRTA